MCVVHQYAQTNTDNVNKPWIILQTTGGKDEPNIVCDYLKLYSYKILNKNPWTHTGYSVCGIDVIWYTKARDNRMGNQ